MTNRTKIIAATVVVAGIISSVVAVSWRPQKEDYREATDQSFAALFAQTTAEDGIVFLENGGLYADKDPTQKGLDKEVVLPLLRRLRDELGVRPQALVMAPEEGDEGRLAAAMGMDLPRDPVQVEELKQFFLKADKDFAGVILHQYGHQYMFFDFLSEQNAAAIELTNWEVD